MTRTSANRWGVGAVAAACLLGAVPTAQGQGFFQPLFGAFSDNPALAPARPEASRPEPSRALPFASDRESHPTQPRARASISDEGGGGGSQAYCVRTCDGRYFPLSAGDGQSHAASCNSFCPASDTRVVYGSSIDSAATEKGKLYSQLPNAFRYRTELVAGCTCNGKDQVGLAAIKIEDDPTLRKGDIVAGANGLVIASRVSDKRGVDFSPASASLRAKYQRVPVVAAE
jgi:hypothetical protein